MAKMSIVCSICVS